MSGDIKEAKVRLPLPQLLRKIGDGAHAKTSCCCPFHKGGEEANKSFSVFKAANGDWLFKCHSGCGSGDGVTYLEKRFGLSTADAMRRYCSEAGLSNGAPLVQNGYGEKLGWPACVKALTPQHREKVAAWRGVSVQSVNWLHQLGIIGLVDGLIGFAVLDEQGKILGCHYRRKDGTWRYKPKGTKLHPLVFGATRRAARVLVFESQWDALAGMDKLDFHVGDGLPQAAVLVTRGAANGKMVSGQCSADALVYAFVQNDEPDPKTGKIPSEEWLKAVAAAACCKVLRVETPAPHKDLNDWTRAGATRQDIEAAMEAASPIEPMGAELAEAKDPLSMLSGERPKIQLPCDNRLLSEVAREVGAILAGTEKIFKRGGLAFILNERRDALALMVAETLRTWVEDHLVCYKVRNMAGTDSTIQFKRTLSQADAAGILASPQFLERLPQVERLNFVRVPVMRRTGQVELLRAGYDAETKSFTVGGEWVPADMDVGEAKLVIDQLLSEFVFADQGRSLAVAVASMVTVFGLGLLPRKSLRPCFIFLANAEGAGKTLLVKVATVPVLGYAPVGTAPKDETEMQKVLLTAILEGRQILFLDNFKRHVSSAALEGFLTASDYEGRILGQSKSFRGENNCITFITGNGATVSPDMRRRSLFCELFLEAERAEDRTFKNNLEVPTLLERRSEILSALWALVQEWDRAGRPKPTRGSSSFPDWSNIIGGIVEHSGFGCPLEAPQIEAAVDTDGADVHALVSAIADGALTKAISFEELVEVAREGGLFERVLPADGDLDARARSSLGKLFKRYDRRIVGGYRFSIEGKGHSRMFKVEALERTAAQEPEQQSDPSQSEPDTEPQPATISDEEGL